MTSSIASMASAIPRRHVLRGLSVWPVLPLAMAPSIASAAPSAQAILAASDAVRNPDVPFGLTNTLTEYRNGQQTDSLTLAIVAKADPDRGPFRSLVRFVAPARDAGKLMLYAGRDLWFYDPASKASIRLSPQQRLLGQASNGDVVTVNLSRDHRAEWVAEEEITDGERRPRRCHRLRLQATVAEASYPLIELWVDTATSQPLKARYLAASGQLLKTAYFRRWQRQLGQERPTETVIIDGLDPGWVTVMRYSDWVKRDVPDAWLQRDHLPQFRP